MKSGWLVLGAGLNEIIKIGDDIEIAITREPAANRGTRVAIRAPKHIPIKRSGKMSPDREVPPCGSPS